MIFKPKVHMVSYTKQPLLTTVWAWDIMHNSNPAKSLYEFKKQKTEKEILNIFRNQIAKSPHQTVFEYINTVWFFDNVSRAFQQQLTRHRLASYSIQSLRVVPQEGFADKKRYHLSDKVRTTYMAESFYRNAMKKIQNMYKKAIDLGLPVEDARGLLPLNIYSPITMAINFRSLVHLLGLRFCKTTQGEFRCVAEAMKEEVRRNLGDAFAEMICATCDRIKKCLVENPEYRCGKYEWKENE